MPATVPEYGWGGPLVEPGAGRRLCQVMVTVPEPVGNEGAPHPVSAIDVTATSPPTFDMRTKRRSVGMRHDTCRAGRAMRAVG
jgi:hypothetical protein